MFTYNDFFCGCGGFGLGFKQAGFTTVGAWDFDKYAVESYRENVDPCAVQMDVSTMSIEDILKADVWSFGFPCQDLSIMGRRKGMVLECDFCGHQWKIESDDTTCCPNCGFEENHPVSRSGLFFEIMRLLQEAREHAPEKLPKVIVAENVKQLKKLLPILEKEYKKQGYTCQYRLFNSKYWGVPQNRERYFVIGIRDDLPDDFVFPEEQHKYIPRLYTKLDKEVSENFYIADEKAWPIFDALKNGTVSLKEFADIPSIEMLGMLDTPWHEHNRRVFKTKGISPTVTAVAGGTHHIKIFDEEKWRVRKLTPIEYGRLQGFPMKTWKQVVSNTQAYRQFGNAVTVSLAKAIAEAVSLYLSQLDTSNDS